MDGVCVELAIDGSLVNGARNRRIDEFTIIGDNENKIRLVTTVLQAGIHRHSNTHRLSQ